MQSQEKNRIFDQLWKKGELEWKRFVVDDLHVRRRVIQKGTLIFTNRTLMKKEAMFELRSEDRKDLRSNGKSFLSKPACN